MSIEITGLRKTYGGVVALEDLDLEIGNGEMLVLLGPSGSGKTTAMRSVVGLENPDHGKVTIEGRTVYDSSKGVDIAVNKRDVGMVFQSYAIWPHKTVFDNVAFGLRMKKEKPAAIKEQVHQVMEALDILQYSDRGASMLSGGQMQRVALARSLAMKPKVLLFDEPLSNLDAKLRDRLRFEIRAIQQEFGITSMYVTHDQSEALALADRIAVMRAGRIEQLAGPVELYSRPRNEFVADFLGVKNLYHARVVEQTPEGTVVETERGGHRVLSRDKIDGHDIVCVCIRPEDVAVGLDEGVNTWQAKVEVASFLGASVAHQLELAGGLEMNAVSGVREGIRKAGTTLPVHVPPEQIQLLPAVKP